jgi:hypothetical protein
MALTVYYSGSGATPAGLICGVGGPGASTIPIALVPDGNAIGDRVWFFKTATGAPTGFSRPGVPWFKVSTSAYDDMVRGRLLVPTAVYTGGFSTFPVVLGSLPSGTRAVLLVYVTAIGGGSVNVTLRSSANLNLSSPTTRITFPTITTAGGVWQEIAGPIADGYWYADVVVTGAPQFLIGIGLAPNHGDLSALAIYLGPPATPTVVAPSDGASDVSIAPQLSWTAGGATTYDVYFGSTNPPPLVSAAQTAATYATGLLSLSTVYYWKITATNAYGSTTGAVSSFTTTATVEEAVTTINTTATGTQDNFAPGSFTNFNVLRCGNASLLTIRGLAGGSDGMLLWIVSTGAGQVDFANDNANSTAAARMLNGVTGTISLSPGSGRALLEYDGTTQRWRVLQHEQGAWITPAYSGTDYSGVGPTWTVDSGDVTTAAFCLCGRRLSFMLTIDASSISGTGIEVVAKIPGGFNAAKSLRGVLQHNDTGQAAGYFQIDAGTNIIQITRFDFGNFAAHTNNFGLSVHATIEV